MERKMQIDTIKGLFKSRVFYFNVVTIGLEVANAFSATLPPGALTLVNAIGNIALRMITSEPLADKIHRPPSSTIIEFLDSPKQ
jgi:hypothetical protein